MIDSIEVIIDTYPNPVRTAMITCMIVVNDNSMMTAMIGVV